MDAGTSTWHLPKIPTEMNPEVDFAVEHLQPFFCTQTTLKKRKSTVGVLRWMENPHPDHSHHPDHHPSEGENRYGLFLGFTNESRVNWGLTPPHLPNKVYSG